MNAIRPTFDADFEMQRHLGECIGFGQDLLKKGRSFIQSGDIESINAAKGVFSAVSAQLTSTEKMYERVRGNDRQKILETVLLDTLREMSPELAESFIHKFKGRLAQARSQG